MDGTFLPNSHRLRYTDSLLSSTRMSYLLLMPQTEFSGSSPEGAQSQKSHNVDSCTVADFGYPHLTGVGQWGVPRKSAWAHFLQHTWLEVHRFPPLLSSPYAASLPGAQTDFSGSSPEGAQSHKSHNVDRCTVAQSKPFCAPLFGHIINEAPSQRHLLSCSFM